MNELTDKIKADFPDYNVLEIEAGDLKKGDSFWSVSTGNNIHLARFIHVGEEALTIVLQDGTKELYYADNTVYKCTKK